MKNLRFFSVTRPRPRRHLLLLHGRQDASQRRGKGARAAQDDADRRHPLRHGHEPPAVGLEDRRPPRPGRTGQRQDRPAPDEGRRPRRRVLRRLRRPGPAHARGLRQGQGQRPAGRRRRPQDDPGSCLPDRPGRRPGRRPPPQEGGQAHGLHRPGERLSHRPGPFAHQALLRQRRPLHHALPLLRQRHLRFLDRPPQPRGQGPQRLRPPGRGRVQPAGHDHRHLARLGEVVLRRPGR